MIKTGYRRLRGDLLWNKRPKCQSCGGKASKVVTFEDNFSKLKVRLCDDCAEKSYENLLLQGRFSWPE